MRYVSGLRNELSVGQIFDKLIDSVSATGGASVHTVSGKAPRDGFMVSLSAYGWSVPRDHFRRLPYATLMAYWHNVYAVLADRAAQNTDTYLGAWTDDGKVYFDLSEQVQDRYAALTIARDRGQRAIYDVVAAKTIYVD